jgi:hypothetical protein
MAACVRWMHPIDKSDTLLHYWDLGTQHTSDKLQRLMEERPSLSCPFA